MFSQFGLDIWIKATSPYFCFILIWTTSGGPLKLTAESDIDKMQHFQHTPNPNF